MIPPNSEIRCVAPVGVENLRIETQKLTDAGFTVAGIYLTGSSNYSVLAWKAKA